MAKTEICVVSENVQLTDKVFSLKLETEEIAKLSFSGQFVHIKCGEGNLLRRPISISDAEDGILTVVFERKGEGTKWLSERKAGDKIDVLGPLGNGYDLTKAGDKPLFIGGGIGVPPLYLASKNTKNADAILGFRNKDAVILKELFDKSCSEVFVCTDDGSNGKKAFVSDVLNEEIAIKKYTAIYSCGPRPMLKAIAEIAKENDIFCQVSMEERMGCGVGACLVCACKVKSNDNDFALKHVCKDGPVFNAEEVEL